MSSFTVLDGGLFTTVQDDGRKGYRKYGVPASGVMDVKSYQLANWLVENPEDNPVLELTLKGGTYRFESDATIALTGALMTPRLNGIEVEMNRSLSIKSGDVLELGFVKRGARTYLSIQGNLNVEEVMNSYSTYTLGKFGGYKGRALKKGDRLKWENTTFRMVEREALKTSLPYFSSKISIPIMKGLEWEWLTKESEMEFLTKNFKVSSQSDRMGIRLEGFSLTTTDKQMVSSPVIPGIIQLPPNGNPIILSQDGQTVGGYPRIAKVLDKSLWRLGQVKSGDVIRFDLV